MVINTINDFVLVSLLFFTKQIIMKICVLILTISLVIASHKDAGTKEIIKHSTGTVCIAIPEDINPELYPLYDSGVIVGHTRVQYINKAKIADSYYPIVKKLMDAACKDGVEVRINSGYRTFQEQMNIRRRYLIDKRKRDSLNFILNAESEGFFPETGRPGHSRHHTGIAYDFNTKNPIVFDWLKRNALKHGFVRTIDSERWHWEYMPNVCDPYYYIDETHWSWKNRIKLTKQEIK